MLLIAAVLVIAAAIIWFYPQKQKTISQNQSASQVEGVSTASPEVSPYAQPSPALAKKVSTTSPSPKASTSSNQNSSSSNSIQSSPSPSPSPAQSTGSQTQTFQVTLKINGSSAVNVDVPQGSNQCDVLSKAKDQGKISSLNMRYDGGYGSYAVYQINGIGNPNSVWWVYKVNGNSPSQGCSYVSANGGDNVEWEYKGS